MPKLRAHRLVDAEFATDGPNHNALVQEVAKPAAALFRCLEDGPAWKEWLGIDVEWTSPRPFGVGTTRTVTGNRQRIEEYFLAWEDGRRMCFRFDRSTLPVKAFAEDYVVTELGEDRSQLTWSYAFEFAGALSAVTGRAFGAGFAWNGKRALAKLATVVEESDRFG